MAQGPAGAWCHCTGTIVLGLGACSEGVSGPSVELEKRGYFPWAPMSLCPFPGSLEGLDYNGEGQVDGAGDEGQAEQGCTEEAPAPHPSPAHSQESAGISAAPSWDPSSATEKQKPQPGMSTPRDFCAGTVLWGPQPSPA